MTKSRTCLLTMMVAAISSLTCAAQNLRMDLDKPDFDDLQSPDLGDSKKNFEPKDWLEIEAEFKITGVNPAPKDGFVDQILVKWYVAVENPDRKGTYFLIRKSVEHVNIPVDEELFTSVYFSPSTVARISGGSENASKRIIERVGIEILYQGAVVRAISSDGKKEAWWNQASDRIASSDKFVLRNKDETPFKSLWWDRYAELKTEDR